MVRSLQALAAAAALARWRQAAVAAILMVLTNGPVFLFAKSVLDRPGHWEDMAVWPFFAVASVAAAALALLDRDNRPGRPRTTGEWTAAAAVAWYALAAVVSTAWSVDPGATAWRSAVYLGLALLAWVISGLDPDDLRSVLALLTGVAVAGSAVLVALRPGLALDSNDDWEGIYTNRNSLAPLAALGLLVGIRYLAASGRRHRVAGVGLTALALSALVGAGSRTAWLALGVAAGAAAVPMAHHRLRGRWGERRARALSVVAAAAGAAGAGAALAALWDVSTFSQRRTMWGLVWDRVAQRPIGGHGFFTFWDIPELTAHELLRRGSAHNSLMEVALGLGLLGAVPFSVIVALAARNAGLRAWRHPGADTWLWAAVVAFVLVENVTESFVLWFSYNWVLVMAAALRPAPPRAERVADDAET